ncbi:hypothetical protein OG885_00690 [Streptomyces sp. NBC_00028]|uniref:hypothetical protein n=1 Tax=Streptomyces sp. NBC_00028 TaxID=2975624 RepID=UPI0032476873
MIAAAAVVIVTVIVTGILVARSDGSGPDTSTAAASSPPSSSVTQESAEEVDSEPTYAELGSDDFSIELQTTSRQCFGSAGCLLTVEPDLTLVGDSADIDPDVVYEITYEIAGDESGPVVATAELTNQEDLTFTPSRISTDSSSTDVTVEITQVDSHR